MTNQLPMLQQNVLLEQSFDAQQVWGMLSEREREQVSSFVRGIDLSDPSQLQTYAAAEQGAMQTWLDVALSAVSQQDMQRGEKSVTKMLEQLREWDRLCRPRMLFFGGAGYARLQQSYQRLAPAVEETAGVLLDENVALRRISKLLERMAEENQAHLTRLTSYLLCGQLRLNGAQNKEIKEAMGNLPEIAGTQAQQRFERRLHDIALTRQVNLQLRAQILMLLEGNRQMIDTMERTLRHTLPLWKTQALLTLGLSAQAEAQDQAVRAQAALQKQLNEQGPLLTKLLRRIQGGAQRIDRAKLRENNAALLDSVTAMHASLRAQQAQEDQLEKAMRAPLGRA